MSARFQLLVLVVCLSLCSVPSRAVLGRSLSHLVNQQPLLFGRRGINPNMNSLFFGKRTPSDTTSVPVAMDDVRHACAVLLSSYRQEVTVDEDNES
ncbi:hypothetical protein C0Q70_02603 [Pomacea canaliculata]|uniref:Uncharacterized protein n=2 Tax=Pomacea canaliculata TaxID=400727 RepID=A0A2T7PQH0_POMCA|nr:hypothetical protein C0Q70_02603 [Pomacea canaliculata]